MRWSLARAGAHHAGRSAQLFLALAIAAPASPAAAAPRWMLVYYRQIGNIENANNLTIENHLFRENGTKGAGVGVTNQSNSGFAIFGNADVDGWNRINPLDINNCAYDIRIFDPGVATDQSPTFYFQNPTSGKFYSFITHWMYVSDASRVTPYPAMPVYHYDLVAGLNQVSGLNLDNCTATTFTEPAGTSSDPKALTVYTEPHDQTFVVPPGINRIVSAHAFVTRNGGVKFFYQASIRQGGPAGPQIGPTVTSREVFSPQFKEVAVNWGLQDVPVTPGQTYALHLVPLGGGGFNSFATPTGVDNYPYGHLYVGGTPVSHRDLFAVVVGVGYDLPPLPPPSIVRNPTSLTRTVPRGENLPDDTFTISTPAGTSPLNYTVHETAGWFNIHPVDGTSQGEADTITITYSTAGLTMGPYAGSITITAPGATNTPQTVAVNLTVGPPLFAPPDFDRDGDVDLSDFGRFQLCLSGFGFPQTDPQCAGARLDADDDVDGEDFAVFANQCFSGPGIPPDTTCAG